MPAGVRRISLGVALTGLLALAPATLMWPWIDRSWQAVSLALAAAAVLIHQGGRSPVLWLAAPALWGALQLAMGWTCNPWAAVAATLRWASWWGTALLAWAALSCERRPARWLQAMVWGGVVLATLSMIQYRTEPVKALWLAAGRYEDMLGPFPSANNFASFLLLLIPMAMWLGTDGRRPHYWWIAGILAAELLSSGSRAGAVVCGVEVAVCAVVLGRRKLLAGRRLWAMLAVALVSTAALGWEKLAGRIWETESAALRRDLLASTAAMWRDRPWTGFGLGGFESVYPSFALFDNHRKADHAHCDWAEWAAEGGLPLVAVMAAVAVWLGWAAWRNPWGLGALGVLLHSLVDYPMQRTGVAAFVMAVIGALAAFRNGRPARARS